MFDAKLGRTSAPPSQCSVVLVVSPFVALMVNQISHLQSVSVSAAILSGVDKKYQAVGSDVSEGKYCLIYSSPEALFSNDQWTPLMLQPPLCNCVAAIATDEDSIFNIVCLYILILPKASNSLQE